MRIHKLKYLVLKVYTCIYMHIIHFHVCIYSWAYACTFCLSEYGIDSNCVYMYMCIILTYKVAVDIKPSSLFPSIFSRVVCSFVLGL